MNSLARSRTCARVCSCADGACLACRQPIVTGTSVLGIRCKSGVVIAADTLGTYSAFVFCVCRFCRLLVLTACWVWLCAGSYGSLARFRDLRRLRQVGGYTVIGGSGDYSDFENVLELLDSLLIEATTVDAEPSYTPRELHEYLGRVYYARRSKFDPLWNQLVVGGVRDGEVSLGYVDLQGTFYEDDTVATGYGAYIARPLLCKAHNPDMSLDDARKAIEDAMRVLYYRDARSLNRIQVAVIPVAGPISISEPFDLESDWTVGIRTYPTA